MDLDGQPEILVQGTGSTITLFKPSAGGTTPFGNSPSPSVATPHTPTASRSERDGRRTLGEEGASRYICRMMLT
jgi:hypothetical protein